MIDELLDDAVVKKKKPKTQGHDDLHVLLDIYKTHWDHFLKGFAFYLAACAVFASFAVKDNDPSIFQKLFAGIAVLFASLVAWRGLEISYSFLVRLGTAIDEICEQAGYRKIYFLAPRNIVKLFQGVSGLLAVVGMLYIVHILFFDRGLQAIAEHYSARWK